MKKITRHELINFHIMESNLAQYHSRNERGAISSLKDRPDNIAWLFHESLNAFSTAIVLQKSKNEIIQILNLALMTGISNYASAQELDPNWTINYNNIAYPVAMKKRTTYVGGFTWDRVFCLAVILRDKKAIDFLLNVPQDFLETDNIKLDPVDYSRIRFLKGIYDNSKDIGDLLAQVYEDADMDKLDAERSDYIYDELIPEMAVYRCIFSNLQDELNEKLAEGLELHKKKWGTSENDMDFRGWISLKLLAACIIAKGGKGMSINVESDYIPKWLIDGDFE